MAKVCVISLGSESAPHIAECVRQELGDRSASEEWETSKAPVLVVVVECESDGEPCPAARQFVRALRRSECFANYSQSIGRRAAVLGLASSVCANSAAQLGDGDKYTGASRVERALIAGGCTALLKMGTMEACPAPSSQAISISLPLPSASLPHCLCSPALLACHGGLVSGISSTPLPSPPLLSDRRRRWSCRVPRRVLFRGPEPSARRCDAPFIILARERPSLHKYIEKYNTLVCEIAAEFWSAVIYTCGRKKPHALRPLRARRRRVC